MEYEGLGAAIAENAGRWMIVRSVRRVREETNGGIVCEKRGDVVAFFSVSEVLGMIDRG